MYLFELNVETWKIKKLIKMTPVHILFIFRQLYKTILLTAVHQGRKKQGNCVQGEYKHYENQTHFPKRSILFRSI